MHNMSMETRRLEFLVELARLGSMRHVAEHLGTTTSTVSQQIARLAEEWGTVLIEPDGRKVRLTPAGRRLAEASIGILGSVEAARRDLDADGAPVGTVRVAGFVTAIQDGILPLLPTLSQEHPGVKVALREHEPAEALALLADDEVDLALTYDYNLAPTTDPVGLTRTALWSTWWSLAVRADDVRQAPTATAVFAHFHAHDWIGNSRNRADEEVVNLIASMAGFTPHFAHQADSLDLVEELIRGGLGIGLLPAARHTHPDVALVTLDEPVVEFRAYAVTRRGGENWPPLAALLQSLRSRVRIRAR